MGNNIREHSDSELLSVIADELDRAKREERETETFVVIPDVFAKLVSNAVRSIGTRVKNHEIMMRSGR